MNGSEDHLAPKKVSLAEGSQAVINGALVTAVTACELEVGAGTFVLTGSSLAQSGRLLRNPREELYFSTLEVCADEGRFADARFRLFEVLAQVVASDSTYQGQRECAAFAAAVMTGESDAAVRCAARLASDRLESRSMLAHDQSNGVRYPRARYFADDVRA